MAKEKKLVESITAREVDFAQWYTDVVREAKLCRKRVSSGTDSGKSASERKRSYRRICTGSSVGNTWRNGRTAGEILYPSDI